MLQRLVPQRWFCHPPHARNNNMNNSPVSFGARMLATYHALTKTIAGTVYGYSGGGAGIAVDIYSQTTYQRVASTTTAAGGSYSVSVYDGDTYAAVVRQDDAHVGRSANGVGV